MSVPIIDTHCHYNLEPLYSGQAKFFPDSKVKKIKGLSWEDHWQQAQTEGVIATLVAGADLLSSQRAVTLTQADPNLFASVGINPADLSNATSKIELEEDLIKIASLANSDKVMAIGEVGLDYFRLNPDSNQANQAKLLQRWLFTVQIQLANQVNKPLIIHARDKRSQAYLEILELLKANYSFEKPFVLHCASGPKDYLEEAIKLGAYVSFAGNITYPSADELRDLLKLVPEDRLLIETDAPFLAPQAKRGQVNQPQFIRHSATYLERKHGVNLQRILINSCNFFEVSYKQLIKLSNPITDNRPIA